MGPRDLAEAQELGVVAAWAESNTQSLKNGTNKDRADIQRNCTFVLFLDFFHWKKMIFSFLRDGIWEM